MKQKNFLKLLFISVLCFSIHTYGQVVWTGATDNNWGTATNWLNDIAPTSTSDVTIPAGLTNYPTATSFIFVKSITFESGTSLLFNSFIIGDIIYNREVTSNWHLIASPIKDHTIEGLISDNDFVTGTGSNIGIGTYDNNSATASWKYKENSSTGAIMNSKGMAVKLNTSSIVFKGKIYDGLALTSIASGITDFTLIGNPYVAYVNSDLFLNHLSNTPTLIEQTIWLWDGTKYITKNLAEPIQIAPTQGFFVRARIDVTVNPSMLSHQTTDTFLKQKLKTSFELFVNNGVSKKSTKVFYIENKTTGFDNGYDSSIFGGAKESFSVFTELVSESKGQKLAIQTLPNSDYNTTVIPVGLIADGKKEITFSVNSNSLPSDVDIYLEDRKNKTFINLSKEDYTITLKEAVNGVGQFYIHTGAKKLSVGDVLEDLNKVSVYKSSDEEVTIAGLQGEVMVGLYSVSGKILKEEKINSNGISEISLPNLSTGIYIVKLKSDTDTVTKKIILN